GLPFVQRSFAPRPRTAGTDLPCRQTGLSYPRRHSSHAGERSTCTHWRFCQEPRAHRHASKRMSFIAVNPARAASTRLPGKPLLDIAGKPMVVRTAAQASLSLASRVVVATDDLRIQQAVIEHGYEAVLTRADHPTGTDRLAEVAKQLALAPESIVVNVQGDEPLIDPEQINKVARLLEATPDAAIATCATPIMDADALFNPSAVKV